MTDSFADNPHAFRQLKALNPTATIAPYETDGIGPGLVAIDRNTGEVLAYANDTPGEEWKTYYIDRTNDGYVYHGEPTIDEIQGDYNAMKANDALGLPKPEDFRLVAQAFTDFSGYPPRMITWKSMNHYEVDVLQTAKYDILIRPHYTYLIIDGKAIRQN